MNEILKKRVEEAAINGSKHYDPGVSGYSHGKKVGYIRGFNEGAAFALSHQFISVKEALPEPEEEVVLFNKNSIRHYEIGWLRKEKGYSKSKWAITNGFVEDDDITHWMPIPKFETKDKEDKQ